MKFIWHDPYTDTDIVFPGKWEICDRCNGDGTHDPPEFDNGFTRSDFDEDPEFEEMYFQGVYDVPCEECGRSGKVLVIDRAAIGSDVSLLRSLFRYDIVQQRIAEDRAEERAEERYWNRVYDNAHY